jgi:hypothetical protein
MTTLATQIAERIHAPATRDITPDAHDWTASAFVDAVGCIGGINDDGPQILLKMPGVPTAPDSALILDTNRVLHPSIPQTGEDLAVFIGPQATSSILLNKIGSALSE